MKPGHTRARSSPRISSWEPLSKNRHCRYCGAEFPTKNAMIEHFRDCRVRAEFIEARNHRHEEYMREIVED